MRETDFVWTHWRAKMSCTVSLMENTKCVTTQKTILSKVRSQKLCALVLLYGAHRLKPPTLDEKSNSKTKSPNAVFQKFLGFFFKFSTIFY